MYKFLNKERETSLLRDFYRNTLQGTEGKVSNVLEEFMSDYSLAKECGQLKNRCIANLNIILENLTFGKYEGYEMIFSIQGACLIDVNDGNYRVTKFVKVRLDEEGCPLNLYALPQLDADSEITESVLNDRKNWVPLILTDLSSEDILRITENLTEYAIYQPQFND